MIRFHVIPDFSESFSKKRGKVYHYAKAVRSTGAPKKTYRSVQAIDRELDSKRTIRRVAFLGGKRYTLVRKARHDEMTTTLGVGVGPDMALGAKPHSLRYASHYRKTWPGQRRYAKKRRRRQ